MAITIIGLGLLFFLGHGLSWFFEKTKVPDLLILVALGYCLGPVMGFISAADLGKVGGVLSTLALIVILYEGGLHLSAKDLLHSSLPALLLSILSFTFIAVVGTLAAYSSLKFQNLPISILFGVGIGSTSSAIVIPMVKKLSISEKAKTILSLESAFTDVLTIVIFLVLVDSFASGRFSLEKILIGIGPKTLSAMGMGLLSGMGWAILKNTFPTVLSKPFSGEAWALLTYGIIEHQGFNGAIGVLALGFCLANLNFIPRSLYKELSSTVIPESLVLLSSITFLLRTFFFVYLGLLIKFSSIKIIAFSLVASIFIFFTRYICSVFLFSPKKYSQLDSIIVFSMGPRGLACAVLATIPLQKGLAGGVWLQDTLFSLIPITIAFTALFVGLAENANTRKLFNRFFAPDELHS